jgi:dienelactone hydrolase
VSYTQLSQLSAGHEAKKLTPSVHSATLGAGQSDDTLIKIKNGDLNGKGEITLVFGKQDTHVDRKGRTLIRETLDDAGVTCTVSPYLFWRLTQGIGS